MENEILEVKPTEEKTVEAKPEKQKLTPALTLLENSVNVWWKNLKKFVQIYLWGLVYSIIPLIIILVTVIGLTFYAKSINPPLAGALMVLSVLSVLVVMYFSIQAYAGIFLLVKKDFQGEPKELFKEAKDSIIPYITLTVLTAILLLLWTLLLIIPGIIFSIFYSMAIYVYFFEGKTGMEAIKRSKELVKGYWWAVAGRFGFLALVIWIFSVIISIPMFLVDEGSLFWQIWDALVQIISMLIGPIAILFSYSVYQDLVKIEK